MWDSPYFALQLDESTDMASREHLLVYVRYTKSESVAEEFLFYELLSITTRTDVFRTLQNVFVDKDCNREN
jgi:hypothetical protein